MNFHKWNSWRKANNKQLLAFFYVRVRNDIDKQKSWILKYRESKIQEKHAREGTKPDTYEQVLEKPKYRTFLFTQW